MGMRPGDEPPRTALGLGKLHAVFAADRRRLCDDLAVWALGAPALAFVVPLVVALAGRETEPLVPLGYALAVVVLWAIGVARACRDWQRRVWVFENGIMQRRRGRTQTCWWQDVVAVWHGWGPETLKFVGSIPRIALDTADGHRLFFDERLQDVAQLAELVRAQTARHLLPRLEQELAAGGHVRFGPVTLSRAVLAWGPYGLDWALVRRIELSGKHLLVRSADSQRPWRAAHATTVSNLHVLLPLAARLAV